MRGSVALSLALVGTLGVLASSVPRAEAHALLRLSEPEDGAELQRAPEAVTLTFTEAPEAQLSVIQILDTAGQPVPRTGPVQAVPGQPLALRTAVSPLPMGVYTVAWRVVSRVDGHVTGGAFAFGVGVPPLEAPRAEVSNPTPSPVAVPAKWVLYAGLIGLLGGAWVWTIATRNPPKIALRFFWLAWLAAVGGLLGLAQAQRADAVVEWGKLFGTFLGQALLWRALPLGVAGVALVVAGRLDPRWRRLAFGFVGTSAAGVMLIHVLAGHAGASSGEWRWAKIAFQWVHFASVGMWIGGLVALLLAVRGAPDEDKAAAVRRFSTGAGIALGLVAASGLLRAVDEVGALGALMTTTFGRLVLLKTGLLLILALLGAANRYRSVPAARTTLRGLGRIGATELAVASVVLAVTGFLTGQVPPSVVQAAKVASRVAVSGSDFATSVRVQLELMPGTPGPNRFLARIVDYDTGQPVKADRVSLRFSLASRPDIPASSLALTPEPDGTYVGRGSNLSIEGKWTIVLVVEKGVNSVEVPVTLTTRSRLQQVRTIRAVGQPTLYVIDFPDKRSLQVYLDPERPGAAQVHATYFDAEGKELPITRDIEMTATFGERPAVILPVRRFGPGHFIADATLVPGPMRLEVVASPPEGDALRATLTIQI